MQALRISLAALTTALLLTACGGGGGGGPAGSQTSNPTRGQLAQNPPLRVASLSATEFAGELQAGGASGQQLLALALANMTGGANLSALPCGVDVQYLKYGTVGGAGESTLATGALMVPTGSGATCTGARPIVLYAHGTNITKRYNIADLTDSTNPAYNEALLLAALYAAQGYIVVAPNYAGYDASTLPYHPYVNGDQQSKDMIDALAAAKSALPNLLNPVSASSKLFVTGYSQGGYVALATQKALEAASVTVTASAPLSGPYALSLYVDTIFSSQVPLGSTALAPLLINSYKNSYPTDTYYSALTDIYNLPYATGIDTLMPGSYDTTTVFSSGKLPQTALFQNSDPSFGGTTLTGTTPSSNGTMAANPLDVVGFASSGYLINNAYRGAYLADASGYPNGSTPPFALPTFPGSSVNPADVLRKRLAQNDLRGFIPVAPVLLCGGSQDPTVFYPANTSVMVANWTAASLSNWSVLDLESTGTTTWPYAAGFQGQFAASKTAAGASAAQIYHGTLVPPWCNKAAKLFFDLH